MKKSELQKIIQEEIRKVLDEGTFGASNEAINGDRIDCDKCDHSWPIVTGGNDLYTCHQCGHDNTPY
jgi:hypothetical protein